ELAVPRRTESADKSDALQTLRAYAQVNGRRGSVLECVHLQPRFAKAGGDLSARAVFGSRLERTVRPARRRPVQPRRLRSPGANRFVRLKSCTNVLSFSGSSARRKRLPDQLVELAIDRAQGLPEFDGHERWRSVHGCEGGAKDPRLQTGIQSGQFPAVGCEVVALAVEGPTQESFSHQAP